MDFFDYIFSSYIGGFIFFVAGLWSIFDSYKRPYKSEKPSPLGGNIAGYVAGLGLIIVALGILAEKILGH